MARGLRRGGDPVSPFDAGLAEHYDHRDAELDLRAQLALDQAARDLNEFIDHQLAGVLADLESGAFSEGS